MALKSEVCVLIKENGFSYILVSSVYVCA